MAETIPDSGLWADIADDLNTNFSDLESSVGDKADSASLATVATTGSYNDLSNKPVLGTAAAQNTTAFATATQGGKADTAVQPGNLGELAAKDKVGITDLSATGTPSGTTFLRGDNVWAVPPGGGGAAWGAISGTLADQTDLQAALDAKANSSSLATVATTGSYSDLSGTPSLATVATSGDYDDLSNTPTPFSGSYDDLTDKPTLFSGSYDDLTDKPTLFSGSYDDLSDKPTLGTAAAADTTAFATAAQGTKADSALQSAAIGSSVQAYDADTAKTDVPQEYTAGQRSDVTALTSASDTFTPDMDDANWFSVTIDGSDTLANPTNLTAGQSGVIYVSKTAGTDSLAYGTYWPSDLDDFADMSDSETGAIYYSVISSTSIDASTRYPVGA